MNTAAESVRNPAPILQALSRAAATAATGALLSALCLIVVYDSRSDLTLEMDRELPRRIASGVYGPERVEGRTFAWTSGRAEFRLRGLNRGAPWACSVQFRGGRAAHLVQPSVEVAVDGMTLGRQHATNEFQHVEVIAPERRDQSGLTLTVAVSETVIPGPSDPRELGVQIDRLVCRSGGSGVTWPPRLALQAGVISGAVTAAALGLCVSFPSALVGAALLAAGQALPFASGLAPYSTFPVTAMRIAIWIAVAMFVSVRLLELGRRKPLSCAARFVVLFSGGVLYLKLLGLLHPSKLVIDALFHAHRFQAVLGGDYYFTQIMPSGVTFPYAVGLYVFAAPWAALTRDHVLLLRVVVSATEVIAGALLYVLVWRTWSDRLTAALAVVLFHMVPLPYGLIGNANLTNAFGQSVALITVASAATWSLRARNILTLAALFLIASLAFLSHISTAALLGMTLVSVAVLYRWLGDSTVRQSAVPVFAITLLAAALSWVVYYGRFTDVYQTALQRVRSTPQASTSAQPESERAPSQTPRGEPRERSATTLPGRTAAALRLTVESIGWPIAILAIAGVWLLWTHGGRDRLGLLLAAWAVTYLVFLLVGVVPRVEGPFQRYAAEFIGRVVFATYPAAVILAARSAASAAHRSLVPRVVSVVCVTWAIANGLQYWRSWFE